MIGGHLKNPLARTLPQAIGKGTGDAAQLAGKSMPASVSEVVSSAIVKVKLEVNADPFTLPEITVPVLMSEYVRLPLREGCKGMVIAADFYLGAMSGLGGGTADLTQPGNLGALAFVPLGDKAWSATEDGVLTLYGVEGVTITDSDGGEAKVTIKADSVKMELGGASVELADDEVRIVGTLKINGDDYLAHAHSGVQAGGSNTGGVV